jgi:hypothetical protein
MSEWAEAYYDEPEPDNRPEYPNDLDGCAGIMFGALLGFILIAFIVVVCLSAR